MHVGLAWLLVSKFGRVGAGMAFFGLYVWHGVLIYVIVRRLTGFRWSAANSGHVLIFLPASGLVFCAFSCLAAMAGHGDWLRCGRSKRALLAADVWSNCFHRSWCPRSIKHGSRNRPDRWCPSAPVLPYATMLHQSSAMISIVLAKPACALAASRKGSAKSLSTTRVMSIVRHLGKERQDDRLALRRDAALKV